MKRSPAWGTKSILQLNWIFDEYFVTPTAWRQVFEAFGIACKPVLLDRTGEVLDSVVQLDIPKTHELNFDGDFELCKACNIKKYLPCHDIRRVVQGDQSSATNRGGIYGLQVDRQVSFGGLAGRVEEPQKNLMKFGS
jgi:hypothetical protein